MKAVITLIVSFYRKFMMKLNKDFYNNDTIKIANALLGKYIVREINSYKIIMKITETEAYIGAIDKASHAYKYKKTDRTATMFLQGGYAYIYLIYGMYDCLNVVTGPEGEPNAVLIRSGEIINDKEYASYLRYGKELNELSSYQIKNFANGPGKLCKALGISRELNSHDLTKSPLYITEGEIPDKIYTGKRINIDYAEEAKDFMWRFYL